MHNLQRCCGLVASTLTISMSIDQIKGGRTVVGGGHRQSHIYTYTNSGHNA